MYILKRDQISFNEVEISSVFQLSSKIYDMVFLFFSYRYTVINLVFFLFDETEYGQFCKKLLNVFTFLSFSINFEICFLNLYYLICFSNKGCIYTYLCASFQQILKERFFFQGYWQRFFKTFCEK